MKGKPRLEAQFVELNTLGGGGGIILPLMSKKTGLPPGKPRNESADRTEWSIVGLSGQKAAKGSDLSLLG